MSSLRKFRVWDGEEMHEPQHEFTLSGSGHLLHDAEGMSRPTDGVPLFYTGLTDAEGAEIYEGDVLQVTEQRWDERCNESVPPPHFPVVWIDGAFELGDSGYLLKHELKSEEYSVIGNRYENPDLFKEPA